MSTPMHELPEHMLIPVDENGDGPVPEAEAAHWVCWCGNADCKGPETD